MTRKELSIYLAGEQYVQLVKLRETGISMSSVARLAIRRFADDALAAPLKVDKPKRVRIYIDTADTIQLEDIEAREAISRSEIIRQLISRYLELCGQSANNFS